MSFGKSHALFFLTFSIAFYIFVVGGDSDFQIWWIGWS